MKEQDTPSKPVIPDLVILDADTQFMVGSSLRSWKAGVPITQAADIALLSKIPAKRYGLLP